MIGPRKASRAAATLAFSFLLTACGGDEGKGGLPDGKYVCTLGLQSIGNITIDGGRYAGPASESDTLEFYPYDVEGKVVIWKGPMGGLSSGGNSVASTVIDRNDAQEATFHMQIQTSGGNFTTVSCTRE
ncbi:MAG: hypothetical protein ISS15_13140 [Alphaproteobacteria bacterium]|nr:hypothetical protein [Alphaproteobacteria bacterium]MBL6936352.1 hypothetical protein [Alphaproteobacteria bacterium]MBL7098597.1 hypothetical protein [Alphaproteobacteria bacterium]